MLRRSHIRHLMCTVLLGGLDLVAYGTTAEASTPQPLPSSCAELKTTRGVMGRNQVLYLNADARKPYIAFCDTNGGTYLTLPGGEGRNFSQYTHVNGGSVQTTWNRVRFDPDTLTIDAEDYRFSTSTGYLPGWDVSTATYGMAGDCSAPNSSQGRANVDLSGLPFKVTATWGLNGFYPAGSASKSSNDQIVNITGGGYCGTSSVSGAFTLDYLGYDSCDAIVAAGGPQDREYTLRLGLDVSKPYIAFCATGGGTYLTLPGGAGRNFSQYVQVNGGSVQTTWNRVRFNPATLTLDTEDYRFSTSTGYLPGWNVSAITYGTAGDCASPNSSQGRANVDLSGLPFKVTATWLNHGFYPAGSASKSSNDQIVNVTGGGYCGNSAVSGAFTLGYFKP